MTRKLAIRLSLLSSIIYIVLSISYFVYNIINSLDSSSPSIATGIGFLLAILIPHYFMYIIATIFNLMTVLKKNTKNYLIIINIILYIIAGALGIYIGFFFIISIIFQIIFLIVACNK
ncbi:hypothetical protein [Gemella sp.]